MKTSFAAILFATLRQFLGRLQAVIQLLQQYMTGEAVVRVIGENGSPLWLTYDADYIQGQFDYEVEAGSTQPQNETFRRQSAMQMIDAMAPFAQAGVINMPEMAKYILQFGFGVKDPEQFIQAPPPPPPAMGPGAGPPGQEQAPGQAGPPAQGQPPAGPGMAPPTTEPPPGMGPPPPGGPSPAGGMGGLPVDLPPQLLAQLQQLIQSLPPEAQQQLVMQLQQIPPERRVAFITQLLAQFQQATQGQGQGPPPGQPPGMSGGVPPNMPPGT